ncbi:hypothetical protein PENANT_c002G07916 [Penicillium antarcticum]|uniref:Uncharacterized protein n=1 Tax=Penicillium antarcticum TaxID=416450 RepID=A0A1V6QK27_9EURO|nr:hypothetical protein PENANT_c002G07916 [Penicillium antarcticum]
MLASADLNMILRDLSAFNMGRGAYDTTGVKKPGASRDKCAKPIRGSPSSSTSALTNILGNVYNQLCVSQV